MKKCLFAVLAIVMIALAGCSSESMSLQKDQSAATEKLEASGRFVEQTVQQPTPDTLDAAVISVVDGDTIKVKLDNGNEERVRMTLVDTPETKHPDMAIQPLGEEAAAFTESHLAGKNVKMELDVQERDQYGRLLAYVWLGEQLFNQLLVERGLARVAVFPPNTKYVDEFRSAQVKAEAKGIGIWSIENYVQDNGYNRVDGGQSKGNDCQGNIKGNKNSKVYHMPSGKHYDIVAEQNIVWFCSEKDAEAEGYRPAG